MQKIIYIAGFRQHAGKTFTSLGIISRLREVYPPNEIGYIKPVGQELFTLPDGRKIDKDAIIIKEYALPSLNLDTVSPVRLGRGVTKSYLESQDQELLTKEYCRSIDEAISKLKDKKIIIAEGTGHPGVGGIVNLSNSDVSIRLNSDIIYLAGGGIGKTLDMLEVDLNYFHSKGARVKGIIFNKLIPNKIDDMKKHITEEYITKRFSKDGSPIHILGWMPEVKGLNKPSMRLIKKSFQNAIIAGDSDEAQWNRPVTGVTIISQSYKKVNPQENVKPGSVIILSSNSLRRLKKILVYTKSQAPQDRIAGFIFTCTKKQESFPKSLKLVTSYKVPAIYVREDTSTADEILYKCIKNTKLQSHETNKSDQIIKAFKDNFDLEKFKNSFLG